MHNATAIQEGRWSVVHIGLVVFIPYFHWLVAVISKYSFGVACLKQLKIKSCRHDPIIQDVEAFWCKTEAKPFTLYCYVWLSLILWFSLSKKGPPFWGVIGWLFLILFYHVRHLQQIRLNENFCRIYGLAVIETVTTLKIFCQMFMGLVAIAIYSQVLKTL